MLLVMTAGLVGSQLLMYGYIKSALGARPGEDEIDACSGL